MARMSNKLTGRDFSTCSTSPTTVPPENTSLISGDTREVEHGLSVKLQVQKLILQATSHENLCQNYVGYVFNISYLLMWKLILKKTSSLFRKLSLLSEVFELHFITIEVGRYGLPTFCYRVY